MTVTSRRTLGLVASLVLAGGAISGTAASAQYGGSGSGCWNAVVSECSWYWNEWGYGSNWECSQMEPCLVCPDAGGHSCPVVSWLDHEDAMTTRHPGHGH